MLCVCLCLFHRYVCAFAIVCVCHVCMRVCRYERGCVDVCFLDVCICVCELARARVCVCLGACVYQENICTVTYLCVHANPCVHMLNIHCTGKNPLNAAFAS